MRFRGFWHSETFFCKFPRATRKKFAGARAQNSKGRINFPPPALSATRKSASEWVSERVLSLRRWKLLETYPHPSPDPFEKKHYVAPMRADFWRQSHLLSKKRGMERILYKIKFIDGRINIITWLGLIGVAGFFSRKIGIKFKFKT